METAQIETYNILVWDSEPFTIEAEYVTSWETLYVKLHEGGNYFQIAFVVARDQSKGEQAKRTFKVYKDQEVIPDHTQWIHIHSGGAGTKLFHLFERVN